MRIFITGSTGYIGNRLTSKLLHDGHEIIAFCRSNNDPVSFDSNKYHIHYGDICDEKAVIDAMEGCEVAFHLAGLAKVWTDNPKMFYDVHVLGTRNVLEGALKHNLRKVIVTSTGATFGVSNGVPLTEESIRTIPFFTDYEISKFVVENLLLRYTLRDLHVVSVHPTKVYGPGLWTASNAVSQMIMRYMRGDWHFIPGDGRMIGNFSFIDDVVKGHILAMEHGRPGEKYILGGVNISFNDFFDSLKRLSEKNI